MRYVMFFTLIILLIFSIIEAVAKDTDRDQIINSLNNSMLTTNSFESSGITENVMNPYDAAKGVLVVQIPDDSLGGTIYACQRDTTYDSGVGYDADLVDDIDVPIAGWDLDSFTVWFGGWGVPWTGFGPITNFYFLVWEDSIQATPYPKMDSIVLIVLEVGTDVIITDYDGYHARADGVFPQGFSLPGGAKYWIEFKPTNPFISNSKTGIASCNSAGGNASYMSFPLIGINRWTIQSYELSFILYGNEMTAVNWWDFETGWQGWEHTNGAIFPAGWGVISSAYTVYSYTVGPPNAGDSCFCIDSDAADSAITDTVMSPPFRKAGDYIFWGIHFQDYAGRDTVEVLIRERIGTSWGPWTQVFQYTTDTPPTTDSADVSAMSDTLQVAFYYWAGNWDWFAAFDNVGPWSDTSIFHAVEEQPIEIVQNFKVSLLTPSIFSNNVAIQYALPVSSEVSFRVFDLSGREVRGENFSISAGTHTINWNCVDNNNNQVSAGTYFYCLEAGDNRVTGKLIIAR